MTELTVDAREAIRAFIWQTVAPSGLAIAVFFAAAGFLVKDWAVSQANSQVESKVQTAIDRAQEKLDVTLKVADSKLTEVYKAGDKLQASHLEADITASKLERDLESIRRLIPLIDSLTPPQLAQLNDLLHKIALGHADNGPQPSSTPIQAQNNSPGLEAFVQSLANTSTDRAGIGGGSSSRCPPGTFAIGFDLQTSPGGPHGIVYGGTAVCRDFPSAKP